ncbi:Retrovirus-related Pol polyprotein from transposon 412 [Mycena venus]|uniref:Retrovirus-related Pol polyprotein from transposon 412 n=1 Tax=Mycena venus TaxID=2733690 RepID=A0A8H6XD55_9AGAR|nr:Retrovirus-related Pol polyprotein from transposon 412 [Mycena venus]
MPGLHLLNCISPHSLVQPLCWTGEDDKLGLCSDALEDAITLLSMRSARVVTAPMESPPNRTDSLRRKWFAACEDLMGPIPLCLPPIREINHEINLVDDSATYHYRMPTCAESLRPKLREKINRYVAAGWWELKPVPQAAPLLVLPKKVDEIRTVVDARQRNDNSIKDVTPFPDQDSIRMDVARAPHRSKIDMSDAYEQIRVVDSDVWKTAFATPFGTAVSHVMQQGDCNAPATFQRLMTWVFHDIIGDFAIVRKTPILRPIDPNNPDTIWIICDASVVGIGAMYGQGADWKTCRPAGFLSKKFTSAQRSYKTYEQEALAVIEGLMKWEDKLLGRRICIVSDHKALEAVKTAARNSISGRLIRWDEYLSRFDFEVMHIPGTQNKVADCLSRYYENDTAADHYGPYDYVRADVRLDPELEDMTRIRADELRALSPSEVTILARRVSDPLEDRVMEAALLEEHSEQLAAQGFERNTISLEESLRSKDHPIAHIEGELKFLDEVKKGYSSDDVFAKVLANSKAFPQFKVEAGLIYARNLAGQSCLCIPRLAQLGGRRKLTEIVLDESHSTLGHLGEMKTSAYVRRWYWWPKMGKEVEKFCASCGACAMAKTHNQSPAGLLHSLPIPEHPWDSVGMDFVGPFPSCLGYNYMLVVICRLTSMIALIPMKVTDTASDVAWLYIRDIVRLHGIPRSIVSDRDSKFTAQFWRELHRLTGTKLLMSTSFHPQTDGASERAIRNVSQILRTMVDPTQKDWVYHIPMVEFAINSSISASTGFAPFELNYGYVPRMTNVTPAPSEYPGVRDFVDRALANIALAHDAIIEARVRGTHQSNKGRSVEIPYELGDLVYLSTKNLNLPKGRARKLAPKFIGPYKITAARPETSTYTLELSADLTKRRIHPTFHGSLLRAHEPNDETIFPSREAQRYYDFGQPANQEWFIDTIITHIWTGKNTLKFRVKWTAGDFTWETPAVLDECQALDDYFEAQGVQRWQELSRD